MDKNRHCTLEGTLSFGNKYTIYLHDFVSLEEAREIIGEFIGQYNEQWLLERFGYRSSKEIRESFAQVAE